MANTPGGGAIIMGVGDSGELIGTSLDAEWLRHRVYELADRSLTVDVRPVTVHETRLLVITAPPAVEPIRWKGRVYWRVNDKCVEVDLATWHSRRMIRTAFDWSAQASSMPRTSAREAAVEVARRFLRSSGEPHAAELAALRTPDLLRRLNAVTGEDLLTNAAVIAFVGRAEPAVDYIRRDLAGGDSRQRVFEGSRGVLEELQEVFVNIAAHNPTTHLGRGATVGQVRELPELAVREAVVNGLAHREWGLSQPTTVEHVGATLRVTSPGGFFGGVSPANIITHPSQSRNRALTELFAALRVAEREGIGVDRMVREMLRSGHRSPEIEQVDGPFVRVSLVGDAIDEAWTFWLEQLDQPEVGDDLNGLLMLRHLVDEGWIDAAVARPLLQLNRAETDGALRRLHATTMRQGRPVVVPVVGVPDNASPAWALSADARNALQTLEVAGGIPRSWPSREAIARSYVRARGRISSAELGALIGASPQNVGQILRKLESDGQLRPSRPNRRGRGFYYVWDDQFEQLGAS